MIPTHSMKDKTIALFGLGGSGIATAQAIAAGGARVIAWESASAQANSSLKIRPPCTPSEELPSSSSAVVTSRLLGSSSRKSRGSMASPVVRSM